MAPGLLAIVTDQLAKALQLIGEQLAKEGECLNGRQIYLIVCNYFKMRNTMTHHRTQIYLFCRSSSMNGMQQ